MAQDALTFLQTRRSRPAKTLTGPAPSRDELEPILTAGLRVPDHGKLEPFRLIVLQEEGLKAVAADVAVHGASLGLDAEKLEKGLAQFRDSALCVVVISSPVPSEKIPPIEQVYSAGCVCLQVLNAALASGWGANWLTGWPAHDAALGVQAFGLAPGESIAGFIHIGTERLAPPERPRPALESKVDWR